MEVSLKLKFDVEEGTDLEQLTKFISRYVSKAVENYYEVLTKEQFEREFKGEQTGELVRFFSEDDIKCLLSGLNYGAEQVREMQDEVSRIVEEWDMPAALKILEEEGSLDDLSAAASAFERGAHKKNDKTPT